MELEEETESAVLLQRLGFRGEWVSNVELTGDIVFDVICEGDGCEELLAKKSLPHPVPCVSLYGYAGAKIADDEEGR